MPYSGRRVYVLPVVCTGCGCQSSPRWLTRRTLECCAVRIVLVVEGHLTVIGGYHL